MKESVSDRQALDYLAGKIAAEAVRENVPLSEVERKMLYFSETDWTLPDMATVSAEFDRDYNEDAYESKIGGLVREIVADGHRQSREEEQAWDAAVEKLSQGDHYLLVMVDPTFVPTKKAVRPPHDTLKLWLTAFGIIFGLFALTAVCNWLFGSRFWALADRIFGNQSGFGIFLVVLALLWFVGPRVWAALRMFLNRS